MMRTPKCCFLLLLVVGALGATYMFGRSSVDSSKEYPFLSPRIFVANPNDTIINFTALRSNLREFVGRERPFRTGVYFEYLPTGVSIGVNEKDDFISASLLKVPFIMGVYKRLEQNALHRDDVLTLSQDDLDPAFGTLWKKGVGATLTVQEAINRGLKESDNTAVRALDKLMSQDLVREVYNALDVPVVLEKELPVVSPKNYSSVFRCLYLSCFVTFASSHEILSLLTQTIFADGLPAGVPSGVPVAHKVGVYDFAEDDRRIRSDCGIVYVPHRPYILCIISEFSKDQQESAADFVREVSSRVYQFVSTQS